MKLQLLEVAASALAAIVIMILHELPKSLLFLFRRRKEETTKEEKKKWKWSSAFLLHHYIDPIGLLLCITTFGGFSKPYMFRIRDRKTNYMLGIVGFFDLICIYLFSLYLLVWKYHITVQEEIEQIVGTTWYCFGKLFWIYLGILSLGIFIINLFPISVFDMGLIIAGKSPRAYLAMLQKDSFVKIVVLFTMAIGVNTTITLMIFQASISFLGKMRPL